MKYLILLLALIITVKVTLASASNEQLLDLIETELEKNNDEFDLSNSEENEDDDDNGEVEKRSLVKGDLPIQPERLRNCIKCVGQQREKGMSVKQATSTCNKMCKRNVFENDLEKRFYYWRQRG